MRLILLLLVQILLIAESDASELNAYHQIKKVGFPLGGEAEFVFEIVGESLKSPVVWGLIVKVNGHVSYSKKSDSENLDEYFSNPEFQEGCKNLESCKVNWYLNNLPQQIISGMLLSQPLPKLRDYEADSLQSLVTAFLSKRGYSKIVIKESIAQIKILLYKEHVSFHPPEGPEQSSLVYIYLPSLHLFVPYHSE